MKDAAGRHVFQKYSMAIAFASKLISVFPKWLLSFLWSVFDRSESKVAVGVRYTILKVKVAEVGENVFVGRGVVLKNIEGMVIGNNVSIHAYCYLDGVGGCTIADNVSIAHGSSIITFDHTWGDEAKPIKYNRTVKDRVAISEDVWIGCGVRILAGTVIGSRSVVAAGAVVKGHLAGGMLYGGIPAKAIKCITQDEKK